ncbi:MAG TPA: hypothetical protein VM532_19110 [Burkholderiales bacterium]|nr:hypothetical protein [Burkholderiales bacterium]
MEPNEYFYKLLEIEPAYEAEDRFFEPFWEFKYRFQSLQRHWGLSKDYIENHISILNRVDGDGSAEFDCIFSETAEVDIEYFPEYLRLSTISFSLSLVENLLGTLSDEIAKDTGKDLELDKRPLPYINKYILWLTRGCGLEITIDKSLWKSLDAIREMRNRFIHKIDRDIPNQVKKVISEMVPSTIDDENPVTNEFVDASFSKIAILVKNIELAYIDFYEKQNGLTTKVRS